MIERIGKQYGDETCPSCVRAGDFLFLAHHAGGFEKDDIAYQMEKTLEGIRNTLEQAGCSLENLVHITLWLKAPEDFREARNVFFDFFSEGNFPARMTAITKFISPDCLCMIDGIAYSPEAMD